MEKFVTINDIKNFFAANGIIWDGCILKETMTESYMVPAKIMDIGDPKHTVVKLYLNNKLSYYYLNIGNFIFEIHSSKDSYYFDLNKDLSKEWIKYLLKEHTKEYAPLLNNYCNKRRKLIQDSENSEVKALQEKINEVKKNAKVKDMPWKELQEIASNISGDIAQQK